MSRRFFTRFISVAFLQLRVLRWNFTPPNNAVPFTLSVPLASSHGRIHVILFLFRFFFHIRVFSLFLFSDLKYIVAIHEFLQLSYDSLCTVHHRRFYTPKHMATLLTFVYFVPFFCVFWCVYFYSIKLY